LAALDYRRYVDLISGLDERVIQEDLRQQSYIAARIARTKMRWMNAALLLSYLAVASLCTLAVTLAMLPNRER